MEAFMEEIIERVARRFNLQEPERASGNTKERLDKWTAEVIKGFLDILNDTTEDELIDIEYCGPQRAKMIMDARKQGRKLTIEDLMEAGISKAHVMRMVQDNLAKHLPKD